MFCALSLARIGKMTKDEGYKMTKNEIKKLIDHFDDHCRKFWPCELCISGDAGKIRALLEALTHDEIIVTEKDV